MSQPPPLPLEPRRSGTRGVKIIITVVCAVLLCATAVIGFGAWWLIRNRQGAVLANEGYAAGFRGDHDEAIRTLTAALQKPLLANQRRDVYVNRGTARNWKAQFQDAIGDFTAALRDDPQSANAYIGRGYALYRTNQIDKALADLNQAIRLDANSGFAYYYRGLIFYNRKEFERALRDVDEAVRCSPESADPLILRGLCYLDQNDLDRALVSFDGAISTNPTRADAYQQRSDFYARKGDREKSKHDAEEAIRLKSASVSSASIESPATSYRVVFDQQNQAYLAGHYDRAVDLSNQILRMNLTAAQASIAVMRRGNSYFLKGDLNHAFQDYSEAIKLNPRNETAYCNRGGDLEAQGREKEALQDYSQAINLNPKYALAYLFRGSLHRVRGELNDAMADVAKAIESNPKEARSFVERARINLAKNQAEPAIADSATALQLDPKSIEARVNRAKAHVMQKNYALAAEDLKAIEDANLPKPQVAMNLLAWFEATCPDARMRNGKRAVEAALKACELSYWKNWGYIDTLAAAHGECGQFDDAVKYEKWALQMETGGTEHTKMEQRLSLYEQHKPYRE
jgi:tetratricopeptide (TPR) repeat protein